MNNIQLVELEILKQFISICKKYNLMYFLVCGSCLGAVKYGGFIPWDDDVDVAMPREDYEKFCNVAQKEVTNNLFLQNYKTEANIPFIYSKLRDSNTTFVENSVSHIKMNHGIYIDIFPLDGFPQKRSGFFEARKKILKLKLDCVYNCTVPFPTSFFLNIERFLHINRRSKKTIQKMERLITAYPTNTSLIWCNHGNWQGKLEYSPKTQYASGTTVLFEGIEVVIPKEYNEYLSQKYGDWRSDLPFSERKSHHNILYIDTQKSYVNYYRSGELKYDKK